MRKAFLLAAAGAFFLAGLLSLGATNAAASSSAPDEDALASATAFASLDADNDANLSPVAAEQGEQKKAGKGKKGARGKGKGKRKGKGKKGKKGGKGKGKKGKKATAFSHNPGAVAEAVVERLREVARLTRGAADYAAVARTRLAVLARGRTHTLAG